MSPALPSRLAAGLVATSPADAALFREAFNRRSFSFSHDLGRTGLFDIPRLARAAETLLQRGDPAKFVSFAAASDTPGTRFGALATQERLADTVRMLETSGSWLKLSSLQDADAEYGEVLRQVISELEALSGVALRPQISWASLTIFLASPHIVTPYHMDHESNCLFQISGSKEFRVFDPADRNVLPEREIEQFYTGDYDAAVFRSECADKAAIYQLAPGIAVHHPPLAPHWVRNGAAVSVSVSVGFCLREMDLRARVYQVNRCLRGIGLRPLSPGLSPLRDRVKIAAIGAVSKSNPRTRGEILFSGIDRIAAPMRFAKRLRRHARVTHV